MKSLYFICYFNRDFLLGGEETYFMRMFAWVKDPFRKILILNRGSIIAKEWIDMIDGSQIKVLYSDIFRDRLYNEKDDRVKLDLKMGSICIVTGVAQYIKISRVFRDAPYLTLILYILHPRSCQISQKYHLIDRFCEYKVIKKIYKNNIYFMDEETLEYAQKRYHRFSFSEDIIIRLGMHIKEYERILRENLWDRPKFSILTIARFEFPFKGYILGLIKDFLLLHEKYSDIELNIIGEGEGISEILNIISDLDKDTKSDIHLIGYVAYNELVKYFNKTHLFVGMGTSVLDASMSGVPSIVATAYQREDFCYGYFYDDHRTIGKMINEDGAQDHRFYELIEGIYRMPYNVYLMKCDLSYRSVKENYDIDHIMKKMLSLSARTKSIDSWLLKGFVALRDKKQQYMDKR